MARNLAAIVGLDRPTRAALQDINRRLGLLEGAKWITLPLTGGGWVAGTQAPQYRIAGDRVEFRGSINWPGGGTNPMANLPSAARPPLTTGISSVMYGSAIKPLRIEITSAGAMNVFGLDANTGTFDVAGFISVQS